MGVILYLPLQVRDFAATFADVGLKPHFPIAAYGLAEHVMGLAFFSPNRADDASLDCVSDERLQVCGTIAGSAFHGVLVKCRYSMTQYVEKGCMLRCCC